MAALLLLLLVLNVVAVVSTEQPGLISGVLTRCANLVFSPLVRMRQSS